MPIESRGNQRRVAQPVPPVAPSADAVVTLRPCSRTRSPLLGSSSLRFAPGLMVASLASLTALRHAGALDSCARLMRWVVP